jgi:3-hexulose-6-phosphate synthase/6-phospho-3-hexuloisomerase
VIGAPLAIKEDRFETASGVEDVLRRICDEVHAYGDVPLTSNPSVQ